MWKKFWKINTLKYLVVFLIPLTCVMLVCPWLDNDSFGVIAEGREIVENGIYYTDKLSMHEDLNVSAVQNYGFAVFFYLIYTYFGAQGIYIFMLLFNFFVCYLIYKICMLISEKNVNLSLFITMVTDLVLIFLGFVVTRAQMVSYVIFLGLIYVLELFIKTGKTKYLWWIPIFSLLQVNLHASLWWILILVIMVYIIDSIKKPKLYLQGYKTRPLLIVGVVSLLTGFLNPYGINMLILMFRVYGNSSFQNTIIELSSFGPLQSTEHVVFYTLMVIVLFLYIFGKKRYIRIRYLLMFFGFLALGLNTVKGLSQVILVMFFPLALLYKNVRIEKVFDAKIARDSVVFWSGVMSISAFIVAFVMIVPIINLNSTVKEAFDEIDVDTQLTRKNREDLRIYTGYNHGGYAEFRGYKPYIDPRGGDFMKSVNGKEDILQEWIDLKSGGLSVEVFLKKYDFDYLVVTKRSDMPLYNRTNDGYEKIYNNEEYGIEVYKKII